MTWQTLLITDWGFVDYDSARLTRAQSLIATVSEDLSGHRSGIDRSFSVNGGHTVDVYPTPNDDNLRAGCTCPDFRTRQQARREPCKHILAVALYLEGAPAAAPVRAPLPGADPGWPAGRVQAAVGAAIERLADLIGGLLLAGEAPLLIGPTGVGKTSAIHLVAERLDLGLEEVAGSDSWTEADLLGCWTPARAWAYGPVGRAFQRARSGEAVLVFIDEITRFNPRATDILLRTLQPVSGDRARRMGVAVPAGVAAVYLAEAPLLGYRDWAPADRLCWVAAGNPNVHPLDPALVRRFAVGEATLSRGLLAALPDPAPALVTALWDSYEAGELPLPIEYQALTRARNLADLARAYYLRLRALDPVAAEAVAKVCEGYGLGVTQ